MIIMVRSWGDPVEDKIKIFVCPGFKNHVFRGRQSGLVHAQGETVLCSVCVPCCLGPGHTQDQGESGPMCTLVTDAGVYKIIFGGEVIGIEWV